MTKQNQQSHQQPKAQEQQPEEPQAVEEQNDNNQQDQQNNDQQNDEVAQNDAKNYVKKEQKHINKNNIKQPLRNLNTSSAPSYNYKHVNSNNTVEDQFKVALKHSEETQVKLNERAKFISQDCKRIEEEEEKQKQQEKIKLQELAKKRMVDIRNAVKHQKQNNREFKEKLAKIPDAGAEYKSDKHQSLSDQQKARIAPKLYDFKQLCKEQRKENEEKMHNLSDKKYLPLPPDQLKEKLHNVYYGIPTGVPQPVEGKFTYEKEFQFSQEELDKKLKQKETGQQKKEPDNAAHEKEPQQAKDKPNVNAKASKSPPKAEDKPKDDKKKDTKQIKDEKKNEKKDDKKTDKKEEKKTEKKDEKKETKQSAKEQQKVEQKDQDKKSSVHKEEAKAK